MRFSLGCLPLLVWAGWFGLVGCSNGSCGMEEVWILLLGITAVWRGAWGWVRNDDVIFGNCESGSGALLGAQDNSVFSWWDGLWIILVWGIGVVRDVIRVVCLTRAGLVLREGDWFGRAWTCCRVQGR